MVTKTLLALVIIYLLFALKDCMVKLCSKKCKSSCWAKMHLPYCQNFILRFLYLFFLEFCLCATLQLSVTFTLPEFSTVQFIIAIIVCTAMIALIIFVVILFFFGGPWVKGFYKKGTAVSSFISYGLRARDPSFNLEEWLAKNKVPERSD